ncbi:hypothetical protein AeMF1_012374 [Aphanomyces euteiches]|nr:hypothetical protein AeMF1_012374 [Aphanomyces euteiches]
MALDWMKLAWKDVSVTTISNCFRHCEIKDRQSVVDSFIVSAPFDDSCQSIIEPLPSSDGAHADALASVVGLESACWDEDVAAFETDPNNWEDQIINPVPTLVSDDESDDDTAQEHEPPPSLKDAATALHVLREWNKQFNCGVDSSLHELARAMEAHVLRLQTERLMIQ